jgi:hypothetical protein
MRALVPTKQHIRIPVSRALTFLVFHTLEATCWEELGLHPKKNLSTREK